MPSRFVGRSVGGEIQQGSRITIVTPHPVIRHAPRRPRFRTQCALAEYQDVFVVTPWPILNMNEICGAGLAPNHLELEQIERAHDELRCEWLNSKEDDRTVRFDDAPVLPPQRGQ